MYLSDGGGPWGVRGLHSRTARAKKVQRHAKKFEPQNQNCFFFTLRESCTPRPGCLMYDRS